MPFVVSETDLVAAFRVLFDPGIPLTGEFLKNLEPPALRTAYRRKVFETHPDRAKVLGLSEAALNRRFQQVTSAYEVLNPLVHAEERFIIRDRTGFRQPRRANTPSRPAPTDHFFKGNLPERELLMGQFLFYSGAISWKTLIDAIVWQRRQRPRLGEIARQWRMLSEDDVGRILRGRGFKEKFGACATRKGFISNFQLMALIGKQRRLQRPIGEYFVERRILTPKQMERMIRMAQTHNLWASGKP